MSTSDYISIDIMSSVLETCLEEELEALYPLSNGCCIYRVPQPIRLLNERAYTPKVVSIGLLHYGRKELKAMEEYKTRYLQDFLLRTEVSLKEFLAFIRGKEERLRNCYAESIELKSDEFVKMILVDAAFLIEVLLRDCFQEIFLIDDACDRIFSKPWMREHVLPDLWLLENQLPKFILDELFELAKIAVPPDKNEQLSMVSLNRKFWSSVYQFLLVEDFLIEFHFSGAEHFLDLLRLCLQPPYPVLQPQEVKSLTTPSVKELQEAGVQFQIGSTKNLFDKTFSNGILEIPNLRTTVATESLIRNLKVFEQLHSNTKYMTDYVMIMNCLVNSPKDAEILIHHGVIENRLKDSEEVSNLFHNLVEWSSGLSNDFYYYFLVDDLNKYCRTPWHRWKANLKQNYFNTPWASISVIAAVVLLVLTCIQTVYSVIKQ